MCHLQHILKARAGDVIYTYVTEVFKAQIVVYEDESISIRWIDGKEMVTFKPSSYFSEKKSSCISA